MRKISRRNGANENLGHKARDEKSSLINGGMLSMC